MTNAAREYKVEITAKLRRCKRICAKVMPNNNNILDIRILFSNIHEMYTVDVVDLVRNSVTRERLILAFTPTRTHIVYNIDPREVGAAKVAVAIDVAVVRQHLDHERIHTCTQNGRISRTLCEMLSAPKAASSSLICGGRAVGPRRSALSSLI